MARGRRGGDRRCGGRLRVGLGCGAGADPGRARLRQPDWAGHRGERQERSVRRLGCAAPVLRGTRGRARVLLQRRGCADGALPCVRRGVASRRASSRGRISGRVHRRARGASGRSGRCDGRADRGVTRAVPHPLRHVDEGDRGRARIAEAAALLDTFEEEGAVWARTSAHGDDKDRVLVRSGGEPTYFAKDAAYMRRKYARGFDRLIYVLGEDHHGYVATAPGARRDARSHPRVPRGARVPARAPRGGRRGEDDVEAARGRRLPRRAGRRRRRRRGPLVPRLARPRSADRARRRPREGAHEQERRVLRAVRACADRGILRNAEGPTRPRSRSIPCPSRRRSASS